MTQTRSVPSSLPPAAASPDALRAVFASAQIAVIDHTQLPTAVARDCVGLKHVVFLGTGARSYMNPEELAAAGVEVHTIKGYGNTAVAECTVALMWAAARGFALMDREKRAGHWLRSDALVDALRSGHLRHAGLDVFAVEPLPSGHVLTTLPNVTLSAHSAIELCP